MGNDKPFLDTSLAIIWQGRTIGGLEFPYVERILAMVLGMSLKTFTLVHVLISFAGIASGVAVMYGFLANKRFNLWTAVFLTTTASTSLTGFLFPFAGMTPAIHLGIISLVVLAVTIVTRYPLHMAWRKTYVITACAALYFNVFVLVVAVV